LTQRERVKLALEHKEPDKVPADLGGTVHTGIHKKAYEVLANHIGYSANKLQIDNVVEQIVIVEPEFFDAMGIEQHFVRIDLEKASNWKLEIWDEDEKLYFFDEWGIKWGMPKATNLYFEMSEHPLANCTSISQLMKFPWPKGYDSARFNGIEFMAKAFRKTPHAIIGRGHIGAGILEQCSWMNGIKKFYEDLILNPAYAMKVAEKVVEIQYECIDYFLDKVGSYLDVYQIGDDWCGQDGPLISPEHLKKFIFPHTRELINLIKSKSNAKIYFHCCGSVRELIPDMIEMGIDILNPVQVTARGMNPKELKKEYGNDLTFWGGVDTQYILPFANPNAVREHTRKIIEELAPGGGFIFNTVHNIQANTPPENLVAMYETLNQYGHYGK
jgi:uroporphyrinogen decarboxylase